MTQTLAPGPPARAHDNDQNDRVTRLVLTYGPMILRDARRYTSCAADAEDAYHAALETLLTKSPSDNERDLVPWLRTVVRNKALDIRRAQRRIVEVPAETLATAVPTQDALPEEELSRAVDADLGAEALERLTADQARCLLAYAEGNSYAEIVTLTGFSARKVARCMQEGRRAFVTRVTQIESGSECERIELLLQRIADGDACARAEARPHLRNCAGCRATLHAYREAPSRVAALFPVGAVVASVSVTSEPITQVASVWDHLASAWAGAQDRYYGYLASVHQWLEVGIAKKIGVAALTAAALTAGGAAVHEGITGEGTRPSDRMSAPMTGVLHAKRSIKPFKAPSARSGARRARKLNRLAHGPAAPSARRAAATPSAPPADDGTTEFLPEFR